MAKNKMNENKVVTLIQFDKDGNYKVFNWIAESKKEARQIVEATIKEIRETWKDRLDEHNKVYVDEEPIKLTKEWVYVYGGTETIVILADGELVRAKCAMK